MEWQERVVKARESSGRSKAVQARQRQMVELLKDAHLYSVASKIEHCAQVEQPSRCKQCRAEVKTRLYYCHQYLCPGCRQYKAYQVGKEVKAVLVELRGKYPGMVLYEADFTMPTCEGADLKKQVKALKEGFKMLRGYACIKKHLIGAVQVIETSYSRKTGMYHPHLHCLVAFRATFLSRGYLTPEDVVQLWQKATKRTDAQQIHFARIKPNILKSLTVEGNAARKVQYAIKPVKPKKWTSASLASLSKAMKGQRQMEFYGAFRTVRGRMKPVKSSCLCRECKVVETA